MNFKINQTIPDIEFSSHAVDFGKISVGRVKVVYIRLENKNVVPTEWEYKSPFKVKKLEPFKIFPEYGNLLPNKKQNLKIVFIPRDNEKYNKQLEFKLKSNDNFKYITVSGIGFTPNIQIDKTNINIDPILP